MGLTGKRNKLKWYCDDCGSQILPEKIMGTLQLHCNCVAVQALVIRELGTTVSDDGSPVLTNKKRILGVKLPDQSINRAPGADRGLHDWQPDTVDRIAQARAKRKARKSP